MKSMQTDGKEKVCVSGNAHTQRSSKTSFYGVEVASPLPSCLNEIRKYDVASYGIIVYGGRFCKVEDVQRLVCRRIIKLYKQIGKDVSLYIHHIDMIAYLKQLFNITDAMIEEERRRMKG